MKREEHLFLKFFLVLLFISGIFNLPLSAQRAEHYPDRPDKNYWKSWWTDTKQIALFPKYIQKEDIYFIGGALAATGIAYHYDESIQSSIVHSDYHQFDQFINHAIEPWGNGSYIFLASAGSYAIGAAIKDERLKYTALLDVKTLALAAAFSRVPKYIFQRHRPEDDIPSNSKLWEGPFHGITNYTSFPSGHALIAFAVAAVTASEYKEKKGVVIALYTLAALTAASRVYQNEHWTSDVVAGSAMGFALGKFISRNKNWKIQTKIE